MKFFRVEPQKKGCENCGAGERYDIVLAVPGKEEVSISQSFGDEELADDLVRYLNDAFQSGYEYGGGSVVRAAKDTLEAIETGITHHAPAFVHLKFAIADFEKNLQEDETRG